MPSIIGKLTSAFRSAPELDKPGRKNDYQQVRYEKGPGFSTRLAKALGLGKDKPESAAKKAVTSRISTAHAGANIKGEIQFSDKELFVAAMLSMASQDATKEIVDEGMFLLNSAEKDVLDPTKMRMPGNLAANGLSPAPPRDDPGPPPPQYDPGRPPPQDDPGPPPPQYDPGPPPPRYVPGPPPPQYDPVPPPPRYAPPPRPDKNTAGPPSTKFSAPPADLPPALPPGIGMKKS